MLSFFPLDVLDEIWDLTESVSEGFLTYFFNAGKVTIRSNYFMAAPIHGKKLFVFSCYNHVCSKGNSASCRK